MGGARFIIRGGTKTYVAEIRWSSVSGNSKAKLIESEFPSHCSIFLPSIFAVKVSFFEERRRCYT